MIRSPGLGGRPRALPPVLGLLSLLAAAPLAAQEPRIPPDTLAAPPPDAPPPDTLQADTVDVYHNLPRLDDGRAEGWEAGVWTWDRDDIMASGANTLLELFAEVPGLVPLPAGDYGTPAAVSAFGLGGGGLRILRDGFEVLPLAGGVIDLQRVGLGGVEHVRLRRDAGRMVVDMRSHEYHDGQPYSLVEAGTGDLDNNLFRGTFADPTALGGSVALALERADSRGAGQGESGSRTGSWLRYQLHRGDDAGIGVEFRRMNARSEVAAFASPQVRTDVVARGRARLAEGLVAEVYTGRSTHAVDDERLRYATEGGTASQHGIRLAAEHAGLWADGAFRLYGGDALEEHRLELSGGLTVAERGGVAGRLTREAWEGASPANGGVSGWAGPFGGLSLFGSWETGSYGARSAAVLGAAPPDADPGEGGEAPDPAPWDAAPIPVTWTTERTSYRAGASFRWRALALSAAAIGVRNDRSLPLGLEPDRGATPVPGVQRRGWEAWGRVPGPLEGLSLVGSYQEWDRPGPYLPGRIYRGAIEYHGLPMESGNLELWASLGVRGHDPMQVFLPADRGAPDPGLGVVPFFQSWHARIQVRIVTVRVFVSWDNFTVRRNLQAFPGRVLPPIRTSYGIRWTMWN